jgi:hypothetical protein
MKLLTNIFNWSPEDGTRANFRKVANLLPDWTATYPKSQ